MGFSSKVEVVEVGPGNGLRDKTATVPAAGR